VAHYARIRAAAVRLRNEQSQLFVRYPDGKQGVRDQHSNRGAGETSGWRWEQLRKKVDKFKKFGLTPMAASYVQAPLIDECYANLECKIADTKMVNKYNFFVLEVIKAWIDPTLQHPRTIHHQGMGVFAVDGETIRLPSKMR
jgi:flavin reductase (DIM6/NTAB) family NADH-FMN oxidoreductase RutF